MLAGLRLCRRRSNPLIAWKQSKSKPLHITGPLTDGVRPIAPGAYHYRHASRFLRRGRLRRCDGLRYQPDPRDDRADPAVAKSGAAVPGMRVMHTREGHRPELVDLPANKLWRSKRVCPGIGEEGPRGKILVRGEPGWEIIPELEPVPVKSLSISPARGFFATDLEHILRTRGVTHLILSGITTDVCVHTTMREANDRGFECLLLTDCTAATDRENHEAAIAMVGCRGAYLGQLRRAPTYCKHSPS